MVCQQQQQQSSSGVYTNCTTAIALEIAKIPHSYCIAHIHSHIWQDLELDKLIVALS